MLVLRKTFLSAMLSTMQDFSDFLVTVHHCAGEAKFCTLNSCTLIEALTHWTEG